MKKDKFKIVCLKCGSDNAVERSYMYQVENLMYEKEYYHECKDCGNNDK